MNNARRSMRRALRLGVACLAVVAFAAGCGGRKERWPGGGLIQGTVSIDGEPVTSGRVSALCTELGAMDSIGISADGRFTFAMRLPEGEYVLWLEDGSPPGEKSEVWAYEKRIPRQYRSETKSPLKLKVVKGVNEFPIVIESSKGPGGR